MIRDINRKSIRIIVAAVFIAAAISFVCGAQTAFAAESIPVQVLTYENGDWDDSEMVWEGTYTPPAEGTVEITKAAKAFASKAPEGYSFGIAAIKNDKVDASIYQVEEIDAANDIYRLADLTTYNISEKDVLAFYFYKSTAEVPVYWCTYNDDGSLKELTEKEYSAFVGSGARVSSITVPDDRAATLAPAKTADVMTGDPDADSTAFEAYVVGQDGLLDKPPFDASSESSSGDGSSGVDDKVYYRMGGERTNDTAYKIDSEGLLLQNTSTGIAFAGIGLAGLKTDTQRIDTSNPVVSPAEYEMISGSLPAVYVVYRDSSGLASLSQDASGGGISSIGGMIPWMIAAVLVTVLLILLIYIRMRKRK